MVLTIALRLLASRSVRRAVVSNGIRRISTSALTTPTGGGGNPTNTPPTNGTLGAIWQGFSRFNGFILDNVKEKLNVKNQINFTNIFSKIVGGTTAILNFNWNITDKELDEQVKQGVIAIAGAAGGALGQTVGYTICGGVPAASLAVFNPGLALHALTDLGEQAAEEIVEAVANLVNLTAQQALRYSFAQIYKNFRGVLRAGALGFAQTLVQAGVLSQESVDAANKKKNEPWSFAIALENTIEDIKDPIKQAFIENFWDELQDSCIEAGYVVAGSMDAYFAQQKMANQFFHGSNNVITIVPNRANP